MDHLWSPWRYQYVTGDTSPRPDRPDCIFCAKSKPETADQHVQRDYILFHGDLCFGLLNIYPYTNGHMMIAPYEHVPSLSQATEAACLEIMRYARRAEANLAAIYKCDGLNLGFNIGSAAGAGVAGHIHLHVLPRWQGDANFMSVIGETRVHPEGLDVTYTKLRAANWHLD